MDEPSNSELAWRLERLQDTANGLIGRPEFTVTQAGTERRIDEVERDFAEAKRSGFEVIARERQERADADKAMAKRIDDHEKSHKESRMRKRDLLVMGALPAAVALIVGLLTLWATLHGGH